MQRSLSSGIAVLAVVLFLGLLAALSPGASAQPVPIDCMECSVEIRTLAWNGTGLPGTILGGTFELSNNGNGHDGYDISVAADDGAWVVEANVSTVDDLPGGSGLFASDDNTATFRVNVLVPANAAAGDTTSVTVTATSNTDASATASVSEAARAAQFYGWDLTCTSEVTAEKTEKAIVVLSATNTGNGPDRADVSRPLLAGLALTDIRTIEADAKQAVERMVELGIGLRLDDGEYTLRWDLRSESDETASCTTVLTVTGGQPSGGNNGGGETNDSPAPALLLTLVAVAAVAVRRRRCG